MPRSGPGNKLGEVNGNGKNIFLTSLNDRKQVVEGLRVGGDDYLSKPYHLEELVTQAEALRLNLKKAGCRLDVEHIRGRSYRVTAEAAGT